MTTLDEINKLFETLIFDVCHDTYYLTRDDQDSIVWRARELQKYICDLYAIKKAGLKSSLSEE